jgi:hypothetical protein
MNQTQQPIVCLLTGEIGEGAVPKFAVIPAVLGCLLLSASVGSAEPGNGAAAALRTDSVYMDPAASRTVDLAAVRAAIGSEPIKIAIIPRIESVNTVAALPRELAAQLPGNTIGVISGRYFYAGSEVICTGLAGQAAAHAIKSNEGALDENNSPDSPSDITKPLTDFVAEVKAAPKCRQDASRADRYADQPGGGEAASGPDDTATVLPWVLGGIGLAVLGIGTLVLLTRRRAKASGTALREDTRVLVRRLGFELAERGDEQPDSAAPAEATAKHGEAEAILLGATTDDQFAAARKAALDGLAALSGHAQKQSR